MMQNSTDDSGTDPDLISYFIQDIEYHGRSERTRHWYTRVLRDFEEFVLSNGDHIESIDEATSRHCLMWLHTVRQQYSTGTIATYASCINRFYSYMMSVDMVDSNPMYIVMEEMDEKIEVNPDRRDISVEAMQSFVRRVSHPLDRAIIILLLKTGIRVGELSNIDIQDIYIDVDFQNESILSDVRPEISEKRNSLYIASGINRGEIVNGEERSASNKRKRNTIIPVDDELRHALRAWLAIRPDATTESQPLFVNVADDWGKRITPSVVRSIVKNHASIEGWYTEGGDASQNVTPHYFRHFFTTYMRNKTGDRGIVKYLRGDVADDVIDTYTHNWGDRVRETYEANIYQLQ